MPYRPHSTEQYNMLFHHFWCLRRPLKDAAKEALMNETVAFRAATGWSNGKDGAVGRTAFLAWLREMREVQGAPCCGGMMHPGKRKPRGFTPERQIEMEKLRELESAHGELIQELAKMRKALGMRADQGIDDAPTPSHRAADGPHER